MLLCCFLRPPRWVHDHADSLCRTVTDLSILSDRAVLFTVPETYTPILLVKKAQILRKETGDDRYWAPLERRQKTASAMFQDIVMKPFTILFLEPMLAAITIYMSFVYGCLYLLFVAYPIVFQQGHGFNAGAGGLMFLGLFVGGLLSTITYITTFDRRYRRKVLKHAPDNVPPEARLEMTLLVAPLFAISFFWVSRGLQPFGETTSTNTLVRNSSDGRVTRMYTGRRRCVPVDCSASPFWESSCRCSTTQVPLQRVSSCGLTNTRLAPQVVDTYLFAAASALAANSEDV